MTTVVITLAALLINGVVAWRRYVIAARHLKDAEAELQRLTALVQGPRTEEDDQPD